MPGSSNMVACGAPAGGVSLNTRCPGCWNAHHAARACIQQALTRARQTPSLAADLTFTSWEGHTPHPRSVGRTLHEAGPCPLRLFSKF